MRTIIILIVGSTICQAQRKNKSNVESPEAFNVSEVQIGENLQAFTAWANEVDIIDQGKFYKSTDPTYDRKFTYLDVNNYQQKNGIVGKVTFTKSYYFKNDLCIAMWFEPQIRFTVDQAMTELEAKYDKPGTNQMDGFFYAGCI